MHEIATYIKDRFSCSDYVPVYSNIEAQGTGIVPAAEPLGRHEVLFVKYFIVTVCPVLISE